ncbi:MAG: peptide-methionine (S)-S-oxide reductase MsrA [Saprospiraceae bacterium]|nr:peptide-methionine (S)-S-oxide reductase MsrA [Saprospiraceae bacterium]
MNIKSKFPLLTLFLALPLMSCTSTTNDHSAGVPVNQPNKEVKDLSAYSKAYFAGGCFWCVEAVFESVKGVEEVISGYSGGQIENPTYQQVGSGQTRHAESVEVYYDPEVIDYQTLLVVFFDSQDPTTKDRQGPDRGPQYRSIIFYQNDEEKQLAESYIDQLNQAGTFGAPIVTEVVPFEVFYDAEDYHQDYERLNPNNSYVKAVSVPRLKRFQAKHPELLKEKH